MLHLEVELSSRLQFLHYILDYQIFYLATTWYVTNWYVIWGGGGGSIPFCMVKYNIYTSCSTFSLIHLNSATVS